MKRLHPELWVGPKPYGIGEQKRLEHLRQTAKDLESAVASKPGVVRLAVQDNSADMWLCQRRGIS